MFCCLFNACSTAYYSTQTDPQNYFNKQEPLTIILRETPTITEKKFGLLLGELLAENGFNVNGFNMQIEKTNCYITFSMDISSSQNTKSYTTYYTNTTYISGRAVTTTTPTTNVYTTHNVTKSIGVSIFCKDNQNKNSQIWFGFVNADIDDYSKYEKDIIQNLIGLIGKDFKGKIDIVKVKKLENINDDKLN